MKKEKIIITSVIVLLFIGLFYWYEYRPSKIRKECITKAETHTGNMLPSKTVVDANYSNCLKSNGLLK